MLLHRYCVIAFYVINFVVTYCVFVSRDSGDRVLFGGCQKSDLATDSKTVWYCTTLVAENGS